MPHHGYRKVKPIFSCSDCKYSTPRWSVMLDHRRVHTGERPFCCKFCGKSFTQKSNLGQHLKVHGAGQPHRFQCHHCNFTTKWKSSMLIHNRIHTGEKPYKCLVCGRTFSQSTHCRTHMREGHSDTRMFQCDICSKRFKRRDHLERHQLFHTQERKFGCDICEKKCVDPRSLKQHQLIHMGEVTKVFRCYICPYKTRYKQGLDIHLRMHSGTKPYTCDHCAKCFTTSSSKKLHTRMIHGGVAGKIFKCDQCKFSTANKQNLKMHMQRIHLGVKFRKICHCPYCNKVYQANGSLYSHKRKKHPLMFKNEQRSKADQKKAMKQLYDETTLKIGGEKSTTPTDTSSIGVIKSLNFKSRIKSEPGPSTPKSYGKNCVTPNQLSARKCTISRTEGIDNNLPRNFQTVQACLNADTSSSSGKCYESSPKNTSLLDNDNPDCKMLPNLLLVPLQIQDRDVFNIKTLCEKMSHQMTACSADHGNSGINCIHQTSPTAIDSRCQVSVIDNSKCNDEDAVLHLFESSHTKSTQHKRSSCKHCKFEMQYLSNVLDSHFESGDKSVVNAASTSGLSSTKNMIPDLAENKLVIGDNGENRNKNVMSPKITDLISHRLPTTLKTTEDYILGKQTNHQIGIGSDTAVSVVKAKSVSNSPAVTLQTAEEYIADIQTTSPSLKQSSLSQQQEKKHNTRNLPKIKIRLLLKKGKAKKGNNSDVKQKVTKVKATIKNHTNSSTQIESKTNKTSDKKVTMAKHAKSKSLKATTKIPKSPKEYSNKTIDKGPNKKNSPKNNNATKTNKKVHTKPVIVYETADDSFVGKPSRNLKKLKKNNPGITDEYVKPSSGQTTSNSLTDTKPNIYLPNTVGKEYDSLRALASDYITIDDDVSETDVSADADVTVMTSQCTATTTTTPVNNAVPWTVLDSTQDIMYSVSLVPTDTKSNIHVL